MLKSYFLIAWRSIARQPLYTFINVVGLSLGLSVCLLVLTLIHEAFTVDNQHPYSATTYRVITEGLNGEGVDLATAPRPLADHLKETMPGLKHTVRLHRGIRRDAIVGDKSIGLNLLVADASFFQVFAHPLTEGDRTTALATPNSLVLSAAKAEALFGRENALGKTVTLEGLGEFTVMGVMGLLEGRTHLNPEALLSYTAMPSLQAQGADPTLAEEPWVNHFNDYLYVVLDDASQLPQLEAVLARSGGERLDSRQEKVLLSFKAQPIPTIARQFAGMGNDLGFFLPGSVLLFLSVLAAIVMGTAAFNYTNLSMSRLLMRSREVGIRKTSGARSRDILLQFLAESALLSLLSLGIALLLLGYLIEGFKALQINQFLKVELALSPSLFLWFLLFTLGVGALGGLLPGWALARLSPMSVLRGGGNFRLMKRLTLRRGLVVLQFAVSLLFIVFTLVLTRQVDHLYNVDPGFRTKNMSILSLDGVTYSTIENELRSVSGVENVTGMAAVWGGGNYYQTRIRWQGQAESVDISQTFMSPNTRQMMELKLIAGRDFPAELPTGGDRYVLLSEKATRLIGARTPAEAVGKRLEIYNAKDTSNVEVIGVVADVVYGSLMNEIPPVMFRANGQRLRQAVLQLRNPQDPATLAGLKAVWAKHSPRHGMNLQQYDTVLAESFSVAEDMRKVLGFVALLAIGIATLGLLGMASYEAGSRQREAGVRKVLGASELSLLHSFSSRFLRLLLLAVALSLPLSVWLGSKFLELFARRIELSPWLFVEAVGFLLLCGGVAVGSQALRYLRARPVDILRAE